MTSSKLLKSIFSILFFIIITVSTAAHLQDAVRLRNELSNSITRHVQLCQDMLKQDPSQTPFCQAAIRVLLEQQQQLNAIMAAKNNIQQPIVASSIHPNLYQYSQPSNSRTNAESAVPIAQPILRAQPLLHPQTSAKPEEPHKPLPVAEVLPSNEQDTHQPSSKTATSHHETTLDDDDEDDQPPPLLVDTTPEPPKQIPSYPPCINKMSLPCSINRKNYFAADDTEYFDDGSIFKAYAQSADGQIDRSTPYMIKFAQNTKKGQFGLTLSEKNVAKKLAAEITVGRYRQFLLHNYPACFDVHEVSQNLAPTVPVWKGDSRYDPELKQDNVVLLMPFYPMGAVKYLNKNHPAIFGKLRQNPQGFVWKFLVDISCVLEYMNKQKHWYDPHVDLKDIMIAGNIRNFKTTYFIKRHHGTILHEHDALSHLRFGFSRMSSLVTCFFCLTCFDGIYYSNTMYIYS